MSLAVPQHRLPFRSLPPTLQCQRKRTCRCVCEEPFLLQKVETKPKAVSNPKTNLPYCYMPGFTIQGEEPSGHQANRALFL